MKDKCPVCGSSLTGKYSFDDEGHPRLIGLECDCVENSMANSTDNSKPLVKLAIAILDDPHGISVEAFDALWECSAVSETRSELESIFSKVKKGEGRVYLPEDWDE